MIYVAPSASFDFAAANKRPMALFENLFAQGTIAASSETADGAAANAIWQATNDYWVPSAAPATFAVTLPSATTADCAALIGHRLGTLNGTATLQYLDGTWQDVIEVTPEDDADLAVVFPSIEAAQWRWSFNVVSPVAVAMLGKRLVFPVGLRWGHMPVEQGRQSELLDGESRGGALLGNRVVRMGAATAAEFAPMPAAWANTNLAPFKAHFDAGQAFIWAAAPGVFPLDMGYAWRSRSEMSVMLIEGGYWHEVSMAMTVHVG